MLLEQKTEKITGESTEVRSDKRKPRHIIEIIEIIEIIYWQKCSKSQKVASAAAGYTVDHYHYKSSCRS